MSIEKVVIIGTGPAGHTAAIYSARAALSPLIFDGPEPGGQLTMTTEVENFPGFPEGIIGPTLMSNMKAQATKFGAKFVSKSIESINLKSRPFVITDNSGTEYKSESVIISTGASARFLGLENERKLTGRGVSTCATCDGFFYREKIVHMVGGGDSAMEEATFLTKFASKVYVIHRREELRASKAMQAKAFENPKIEFIWNSVPKEILYNDQGVTGIVVENVKTQAIDKRDTDGLFYAIGHTPNTKFLENQVELDDHGFIKTRSDVETNIPGVFACGDVQDNYYRQAITAAGSGCQAALKCERFLESQK